VANAVHPTPRSNAVCSVCARARASVFACARRRLFRGLQVEASPSPIVPRGNAPVAPNMSSDEQDLADLEAIYQDNRSIRATGPPTDDHSVHKNTRHRTPSSLERTIPDSLRTPPRTGRYTSSDDSARTNQCSVLLDWPQCLSAARSAAAPHRRTNKTEQSQGAVPFCRLRFLFSG
jgi:hypothetical protein